VTLLALLDLSAAFDCVDYDILLSRLQFVFRLGGVVLGWIWSFLTDRSQCVSSGASLLLLIILCFGVPQGSVLGPLLFVLYTAEVFDTLLRVDSLVTLMQMTLKCRSVHQQLMNRRHHLGLLNVLNVSTGGWVRTD